MGRKLAVAMIVLLALPAWAGSERLSAHQRELLMARLEDLAGRLSASPQDRIPGGIESRHLRLEVKTGAEKRRRHAGIALVNSPVSLLGAPELILAWLKQTADTRLMFTPPYHLRSRPAGFELQLSLWQVQGDRPDPRAPDEHLGKLEENLLWFEKQREKMGDAVGLFQVILDAEAVRVAEANWEKGSVHISAQACDRTAREAFGRELALRAGRLQPVPRLELEGVVLQPVHPAEGRGLHMRDLDPADALLLCGEVDQAQVVALDAGDAPLSGHIPDPGTGLLGPLLGKLELPHHKLGAVLVASRNLGRQPPGADMFPKRPVTLSFRRVTPQNLFVLLSSVSRVGIVPPASEKNLTILVRDMPLRSLASAVSWSLGLVPRGDGRLTALLPPGVAGAGPGEDDAVPVDLSASDAPLSLLVEGLSDRTGVIACGGDPLITLKARGTKSRRLLDFLLAGQRKQISRSGGKTYLVSDGATEKSCGEEPAHGEGERLYAVMRRRNRALALIADAGFLRWVAEGEKLRDGRVVRRIRTSRVVLKAPGGKLESLTPHPEPDCPPTGCPLRFDPTAVPLGNLRLAGTAVSPNRAAAALVDGEGNVYLVRKGHLVGRRCGRVSEVAAGRIRVEMECAREYDPKEVWMGL